MSGIGRVILAANLIMIINFGFSPPEVWRAGREASLRWYETPRLANASTTTTTTQRWQDFALGKVVKVGATNYVKVADDQWLAMENPLCNDPVLLYPGSSKSFSYTGDAQSYTFYKNCQYRVELWGASGGKGWLSSAWSNQASTFTPPGGYSSYTTGLLTVNSNNTLFVYVGQQGKAATSARENYPGGWNGGGSSSWDTVNNDGHGGAGGGATDVRTVNGTWNSANSLRSRVAVASGGGGGAGNCLSCGEPIDGVHGGGVKQTGPIGIYISKTTWNPNVTQTEGNAFGYGRNGTNGNEAGGGGGGGWYGGYDYGNGGRSSPGSGGSSYISGHTGCVAVTSTSDSSPKPGCTTGTTDNSCSISPYGYTFTDTVMIDGAGYAWTNVKGALQPMPNPAGGYYASGVGHTGNGAARITRLN